MSDYRSDKMPTREGYGVARALADQLGHLEVGPDLARSIGFLVAWHCCGGFDGLVSCGWHPATVFRNVARTRDLWDGRHPDVLGPALRTILVSRLSPGSTIPDSGPTAP